MFKPVNTKMDFPAMERDILAWWRTERTMDKYLHRNDKADKRYSFIDGPITANNPMGVHHAWGRTYKDLYQRFKTMQGFKQRYQNGFDGQGLWIEVEVEKELGFKSKRDIEAYGIDKFVELCKARVKKFSGVQTEQSIRLGYWMDWEHSYHTLSDENNYTIWHFLKVCHERGWMYEGTDVMPWCPRCGTGLSEHEIVTEGYKEITHPSPYLKFPLAGRTKESLLVWTTTPWTLSSNIAAAVHPKHTYVQVTQDGETLYLSKGRLKVLRGKYEVVREFPGQELIGLRYHGPYDELPKQVGVEHRVIPWDEVTDEDGTGIVHIAPGAGKEDFALGKEHKLPTIAPLDETGMFVEGFGWLSGKNVAEVAPLIFEDLKKKGLLYHVERYVHRYPVCWRCGTELVFRLVSEWFISMKELRYDMMEITKRITWIPEFGLKRELDWLEHMDDWMISKKRYWGLALPIYKCAQCHHFEVIGSETELKKRAIEGWAEFEGHSPHRPWIDNVKIACSKCGAHVSRIKDVGNPWLDAGIVPFSTLNYRHDKKHWAEWFPADWISESFPGQFRNWFYSLLAMGAALTKHDQHTLQEPFKAVFSYALMRDEKGEDMHKSKGNAIWFEDAAEKMGADTMRWMYACQDPAENLNFGYNIADESRRKFIIPMWNVYNFFVTYANLDGFNPVTSKQVPVKDRAELDRWILSELNTLVQDFTQSLSEYDSAAGGHRTEAFVELLSNWYVRRSRRRFWKSESDTDKLAAYQTLYTCLVTLLKMTAPVIPFITEEMYQNLVRSVDTKAPESIHLTDYPVADVSLIDKDLSAATQLAMQVASLGRAARSKSKQRVRQPLSAVLVMTKTPEEVGALRNMEDVIKEELNVKALEPLVHESDVVTYQVQANMALLGPKYGAQARAIAGELSKLNASEVVGRVSAKLPVTVGEVELLPAEIIVRQEDKPGFAVASEGGYTVAVRTTLTPELEQEGLARELVHRIQNQRKTAGFDISDRIHTWYQGSEAIVHALQKPDVAKYLMDETLTVKLEHAHPPADANVETMKLDGQEVTIGLKKV